MARPFVYVNMATSADGKTAARAGAQVRLGSARDRLRMDELRAGADVVLWGANTLRATRQPVLIANPTARTGREKRGRPSHPVNAVVTASGRLPAECPYFATRETVKVVFAAEAADAEALRALEGRAEVVRLGVERVELGRLMDWLSERGVERLLVEGGASLNWEFFREGLVDELYVTLCPKVVGGKDAPTVADGEGFAPESAQELQLVEFHRVGDELFLRYRILR